MLAVAVLVLASAMLVSAWVAIRYGSLWRQDLLGGAGIGLFRLVAMGLSRSNVRAIVEAKVMAAQASIHDVSVDQLESHSLIGGNVVQVVRALVIARETNVALTFLQAAALDLADRPVGDVPVAHDRGWASQPPRSTSCCAS